MIRHWPDFSNNPRVLMTFDGGRKVIGPITMKFTGSKPTTTNYVYSNKYPLLGPYIISNWSEE